MTRKNTTFIESKSINRHKSIEQLTLHLLSIVFRLEIHYFLLFLCQTQMDVYVVRKTQDLCLRQIYCFDGKENQETIVMTLVIKMNSCNILTVCKNIFYFLFVFFSEFRK